MNMLRLTVAQLAEIQGRHRPSRIHRMEGPKQAFNGGRPKKGETKPAGINEALRKRPVAAPEPSSACPKAPKINLERSEGKLVKANIPKRGSSGEMMLIAQLTGAGITGWKREYRFHHVRRWRFDFAWPEVRLAVEVEGTTSYGRNRDGSMRLGRHQSARGFEADCFKYNQAVVLGWRVIRVTHAHIRRGEAVSLIKALL